MLASSHICLNRPIRQENQGYSRAVNRGLEVARGSLIAFLDHDDLWRPEKLERQVESLRLARVLPRRVYARIWRKVARLMFGITPGMAFLPEQRQMKN